MMNEIPSRPFMGAHDLAHLAERLSKEQLTVLIHDKDDPEYAYTLGNWVHGLPELIIFGTGNQALTALLHTASDFQRKNPKIPDGGDIPFAGEPHFKIKDVPRRNALSRVRMLTFFFHHKFQIRQLVMPVDGKYPWEKGYRRSLDRAIPCLWKG